ncbi:E3 ubiquitin-protein ligase TRIM33 [Merluccius polli]|uniref:RING-type E3 ubiquitin transferase n=1 Tax=Merluccius polli TaxID=89951 RepID=A0AA47M608_MERPO|nr:E3 ubiquitin-protein ligase TRIM33 [Merluccius polli]
MADNKGEDDMDTSVNSDPAPPPQDGGSAPANDDNAVIVIEPNLKDEVPEPRDDGPAEPTPSASQEEGEASHSGGGGGGGGEAANGDASSGPAETVAAAEPASSPAAALAAAAAGGDAAPVSGLTTEMSPPPTVPPVTPAATPINLLDTCAVCKQNLQSRECEPKLLPCLHSFCLKCIPQPDRQISVQVPGPHGQTDTHIVNVMRCTVCCQDYKQSDIIDNYFVKDTSEATNTSDEKSAQVCTSCEDNAGTIGFCVECGEWLCKTCVEAHQRVKITKDHKIRTKDDDGAAEQDAASQSVGSAGQRPVFCPVHKQEPLKLFCETCDTLTCRDCQLLEHKEHRYQFLEEAFLNQKGIIETHMTKLQEKRGYVGFSVAQVQTRLKELSETHRKVEQEIKIAVFTLINEINKKGKSLLQQLEGVTKERNRRLVTQHKDTAQLAQQIHHVLKFCHWAINTGSSTALLYSKRLILFQLRQVLKARMEPVPQANGSVRFFCDPTFWAKNVVNLGNLVIEKPPQSAHPPNVLVAGPPIPSAPGHPGKHPGQINLAQLRLQHMQQQQVAYAQQKQQHQQQQQQQQHQQQQHQQQQHQQQQQQQHQQQQHQQQHQQQQHQQQIQQQMRIASQMSQQHARQAGPSMVQQQPPRLISMQQIARGPVPMNGGPGPHMYPSSHHMRLPGPPPQTRMPSAQPRHNGQPQYPGMMQPQLQRQMSIESEMSHQRFRFLLQSGHSNPGHAGPFPVASLHNANPTSPTSASMASMASAHGHRGTTSPIVGPIELIPSVTNPENLPCLPEIPPIQLEDAGSSSLGQLLTRYITASTHQLPHLPHLPLNPGEINLSPGPSTHSPGSSGLSNAHTPARPSSTSSTGSRGSCSSAGRAGAPGGIPADQVRVKQEPGTKEDHGCAASNSSSSSSSVKTERGNDSGRSACMMSSPESPLAALGIPPSIGQDVFKSLGERVKTEPQSEGPCSGYNGSGDAPSSGFPSTSSTTTTSSSASSTATPATTASTTASKNDTSTAPDPPLTNGTSSTSPSESAPVAAGEGATEVGVGVASNKEDDPNEDWCAVCINGGDLLCCDRCPKVFHMKCHVPTIKIFPKYVISLESLGDFLCTFCRSLDTPEIQYCDDSKRKSDQGLSPEDQRRCERLLLYAFCHELSVGFREPVPSSVPNYYKIIKQPMDLKKVKKKLQVRSSQQYRSAQDFVSDVRLVFHNCSKYNEMSRIIQVYDEEKQINTQVNSEMATSGKTVSDYFEEKLQEIYPGQSFPETPEPDFTEGGEQQQQQQQQKEEEATDDSEDDFIQPRRKRLKADDKLFHIK